jgi:hypothetical protein
MVSRHRYHFQRTDLGSTQVIHARSGVPHEIMGLMQGKVIDRSLIIMDSFALPVQGTETRVNAANEANEYMVEYIQGSEKVRSMSSVHICVLTRLRYRRDDWRMLWGGIIHIQAMGVGCPV